MVIMENFNIPFDLKKRPFAINLLCGKNVWYNKGEF